MGRFEFRAVWLCVLLLGARFSFAQTDVRGLEKALWSKPLPLRSYSADEVGAYQWVDGKLVADAVGMHGLGTFTTQSVRMVKGFLVLEGSLQIALKNEAKGKLEMSTKTPMILAVNLHDKDPAMVIPALQEQMFFPDLAAAQAALPEWLRDRLPARVGSRATDAAQTGWILDGGAWVKQAPGGAVMTPPQALSTPAPEYSDEARRKRIRGWEQFFLVISDTGMVREVWLASPLEGLAGKGFEAVRQYKFKPAMVDGHAVGLPVMTEVNFTNF